MENHCSDTKTIGSRHNEREDMEYSKIEEVNKRLKPVDIKGKSYNTVNQRILAFRELCPDGAITTEILNLENGVVLMKATITDELGRVIATGHAQEKEDSSYINKTSFIENAETSCVGRALGMLGIGAVDSLASFEEVANAITQQNNAKGLEDMTAELNDLYQKAGGKDFNKWIKDCGGLTAETFGKMKAKLMKQINDNAEKEKKA